MDIKGIKLYLYPLENVHCGYGIQQGNILPSLNYIPGRVIRGALAGWAVRNGYLKNSDDLFENLFYPTEGRIKVSYPHCTYKGSVPAPLSFFEVKGGSSDPRFKIVREVRPKYIVPSKKVDNWAHLDMPADFLLDDEWPSDIDEVTLKQSDAWIFDGYKIEPGTKCVLDLKAPHQEDSGRVGKGEKGGLFAEESMIGSLDLSPTARYYTGTLYYKETEDTPLDLFTHLIDNGSSFDKDYLQSPAPKQMVFIGHHRVPAVILGEVNDPVFNAETMSSGALTISFFTDLVTDEYPLSAELCNKYLPGRPIKSKNRAFCARERIFGYDSTQKGAKKIIPRNTLKAGSCGYFEVDSLSEEQKKQLWESSVLGIGNESKDGFGRFEIDWWLHQINNGD